MSFPYIVADIGGTNARFALVSGFKSACRCTQEFVLEDVKAYKCSEFNRFEDVFDHYLEALCKDVTGACVSIAGPVSDNCVSMTNLDWSFSGDKLKARYQFSFFHVINDFAANAMSVISLGGGDLVRVQSPVVPHVENKKVNLLPRAIVGPGTGLGVASVVHTGKSWMPVPGEGGHANFAPVTNLDIELYKLIQKDISYVSLETLLCGAGLSRLYMALAELRDERVDEQASLPEHISAAALSHSDMLAVEALSIFCRVLGSAAGNIALTVGASGGVFLTGGILPRVSDFLLQSDFSHAFTNKGVMSHYVEALSVDLVIHKEPALIGSAAYVESMR